MQSLAVNHVSQPQAEVAVDRVRQNEESIKSYLAHAKDESITLCKDYRAGTLDSNSTDRPHPVKIIIGSVE